MINYDNFCFKRDFFQQVLILVEISEDIFKLSLVGKVYLQNIALSALGNFHLCAEHFRKTCLNLGVVGKTFFDYLFLFDCRYLRLAVYETLPLQKTEQNLAKNLFSIPVYRRDYRDVRLLLL